MQTNRYTTVNLTRSLSDETSHCLQAQWTDAPGKFQRTNNAELAGFIV